MARGVSLVSQLAVIAANAKAEADAEETKDFIRKRLREMTTAEMATLFTSATGKTWPFGTVVEHVNLGTCAMVLTDDGTLCKVIMLRRGSVVETGRSIWKPVED